MKHLIGLLSAIISFYQQFRKNLIKIVQIYIQICFLQSMVSLVTLFGPIIYLGCG